MGKLSKEQIENIAKEFPVRDAIGDVVARYRYIKRFAGGKGYDHDEFVEAVDECVCRYLDTLGLERHSDEYLYLIGAFMDRALDEAYDLGVRQDLIDAVSEYWRSMQVPPDTQDTQSITVKDVMEIVEETLKKEAEQNGKPTGSPYVSQGGAKRTSYRQTLWIRS